MRQYLIAIQSGNHELCTHIYGDSPSRPFSIANNLWNYITPWHAAQRLEKLAKSWEARGRDVRRIYGQVRHMPTKGDRDNVWSIIRDYHEDEEA